MNANDGLGQPNREGVPEYANDNGQARAGRPSSTSSSGSERHGDRGGQRQRGSPNRALPGVCQIEMDKEELVRIGHEVYKMAARLAATEKKTRRTLLTSLIDEKIRDMSNSRRSSLEAGERALAAEALAEWGPGGPPPAIPREDQLTPYQRHLAVTREASSICDPEDVARRKQMAEPMRKYIRNKKYSKQARKIYGPDWVQPQCLNLELCYEEEFDEREQKYGLKTRQKFGDVVVDTKYQENLEKMVKRHYKKTNFKDVQESVREIRYMFSTNLKREEKKKRQAAD